MMSANETVEREFPQGYSYKIFWTLSFHSFSTGNPKIYLNKIPILICFYKFFKNLSPATLSHVKLTS